MKPIVGLFLALALFEVANTDHVEKIKSAKDTCKANFNIDDEVIHAYLKERKLPESENGKCFVNCMMEELKLMENGTPKADAIKAGHRHKFTDPATAEKADKAVDLCLTEVAYGDNKCENAVQFVKCAYNKGKEMGISLNDQHRRR